MLYSVSHFLLGRSGRIELNSKFRGLGFDPYRYTGSAHLSRMTAKACDYDSIKERKKKAALVRHIYSPE